VEAIMNGTIRRACAWLVSIGVVMIPFDEVILAIDPSDARIASASITEVADASSVPSSVTEPAGSMAPPSGLAAAIRRAASDMARDPLPVPPPRTRHSFAAAAGGQGNGSLDSRQATGALLLIGGVASLVVTFAGALPAYGDKNCSSASVYDTQDCRRLRAAGLGFGISGIVATAVGIGLLLSGRSGQSSSAGGGTPQPSTANGGFVGSSRAARQAIDEINAQPHGDIPAPQISGRCSGGSTSGVTIHNATAYPLNLYLAGAENQTPSLNPGATVNLRLQPGRYDVGARVSAPNVRPFSGVWDFAKGCPYGYQFYVQ
jgi:hypothetical protein